MKTHLVIHYISAVAKTQCGRYIDTEWVTGKMSEVTCLHCQKGSRI